MTDRILLTPSQFKISKPGYNVLTETNPLNLIVDSTYPGLGGYVTGTVSIGANALGTVSYTNPISNVPFAMIQCDQGSTSIGGGFYKESVVTSYEEDTVPPTRVYETNYTSGKCMGFDWWMSTSQLLIRNRELTTRTFRYIIFYPAQGGTTGATYDVVPNGMDWTSFSGTADAFTPIGGNTQTVSGLGGPISLRLRSPSTLVTNQSFRVAINGSYVATMSAGSSSVNFSVQNGDVIGFSYLGSAAFSGTMNVDNLSSGTNGIDTFSVTMSATPDFDLSNTWSNVSNTGSSSGGTAYITATSGSTIAGINTTATLQIQAARNLDTGTGEVVQIYRNFAYITAFSSGSTSPTFTVNNGDYLQITHGLKGGTSLTMSVVNVTSGTFTESTFTSTITDTAPPVDYTPNPVDWPDIYVEAYSGSACQYIGAAGAGYLQLTGFTSTISMRFQVSATIPADVSIYFAKNNSSYVATLTGSTTYADFTADPNDYFDIRVFKSSNGTYSSTLTITNLTTSSTMDTVSVFMLKSSGPPP